MLVTGPVKIHHVGNKKSSETLWPKYLQMSKKLITFWCTKIPYCCRPMQSSHNIKTHNIVNLENFTCNRFLECMTAGVVKASLSWHATNWLLCKCILKHSSMKLLKLQDNITANKDSVLLSIHEMQLILKAALNMTRFAKRTLQVAV